jgi:hypothetical protein
MVARSVGSVVLALWLLPALQQAPAQSLSKQLVEFCESHLGKKVDSGQCSALAWAALRAAGAKELNDFPERPGKGDYVWGELVSTWVGKKGEPVEKKVDGKRIKPGYVIQYRNTVFKGKNGNGGSYSYHYGHHTSVISKYNPKTGEIELFEQNVNDKQIVQKTTLNLHDLHEGWIRIYRPVRK